MTRARSKENKQLSLAKLVMENEGQIPFIQWELLQRRDYATLYDWTYKGYWDFGVSIHGGWLTDLGKEYFTKAIELAKETKRGPYSRQSASAHERQSI